VRPYRLQRRAGKATPQSRRFSWAPWVAALATAVAGCGGRDSASRSVQTIPAANQPASQLAVEVSQLETGIAEYCEDRSSGSASRADGRIAAAEVRRLIALARRNPHRKLTRDALANTYTVLKDDCADSPLQRPVDRALDTLP
jgi:hypothetical protein